MRGVLRVGTPVGRLAGESVLPRRASRESGLPDAAFQRQLWDLDAILSGQFPELELTPEQLAARRRRKAELARQAELIEKEIQ